MRHGRSCLRQDQLVRRSTSTRSQADHPIQSRHRTGSRGNSSCRGLHRKIWRASCVVLCCLRLDHPLKFSSYGYMKNPKSETLGFLRNPGAYRHLLARASPQPLLCRSCPAALPFPPFLTTFFVPPNDLFCLLCRSKRALLTKNSTLFDNNFNSCNSSTILANRAG